jgi:hypothetical protein
MFIKNEYTNSTLYTQTWDVTHASAGRDHVGSWIIKDVCIHNPEHVNIWDSITEEAHYCMVLLLQQFGLYCITFVI